MSHWVLQRVKIRNINPQILYNVLNFLARKYGVDLKMNQEVTGWRHVRKAQYVLTFKGSYGVGIGINITKDGIEVFGDDHGMPITIEQIKQEILQHYISACYVIALQKMGYKVSVKETESGEVVLEAVSW